MATIVNERDKLIVVTDAATRETDPRAGKYINLSASPAVFHMDKDGVPAISTMTITATPVNLTGTVTWSADATKYTLTGSTANVRTLTFANMKVADIEITVSLTQDGQTYNQKIAISKLQDGVVGGPGEPGAPGTMYATAFLYKWSTATTMAAPLGSTTFDWTTGKNNAYVGTDSWNTVPPANPGTDGIKLWVASRPISDVGGTLSKNVTYDVDTTVSVYSQNGSKGSTGAAGVKSGTARAYQWSNGPAPTATGTATYTYSTNDYNTLPTTGWTKAKGDAPGVGYTLYEASVNVVDSAGATTTTINWTNAAIVAIGYLGTNGTPGVTGDSAMIAYTLVDGMTMNTTPATVEVAGTGKPAIGAWGSTRAWTDQPSVPAANQAVFMSNGIYNKVLDKVVWGLPYLSNLRVGSLSALSANLGAITAGSINIGSGKFTVSTTGDVVAKSISIQATDGTVILSSGVPLNPDYAAPGTLNADLDPKFNALDAPLIRWDFASSEEGFAGGTATVAHDAAGGYITLTPTGANSSLRKGIPVSAQFKGSDAPKIRARVKRISGTGAWEGNVYFLSSTTATSYASSWYANVPTAPANPDDWNIIEWDMSKLKAGGNVWMDETITAIRFDLISDATAVWAFDWVAIGKFNSSVSPNDVREAKAAADAAKGIADAAKARTDAMASDSTLDRSEKIDLIREWAEEDKIWAKVKQQATSLGVSTTDYDTKHNAASAYLIGLSPAWNDTTQDTAINRTTFRDTFNAMYEARVVLQNAIAAKAATMATWDSVTGLGKPQPGRGLAMNEDPQIENPAVWNIGTNVSIATGAGGNAACPKYLRMASGTDQHAYSRVLYPISSTRTYSLTAMLYAATGNNRNMYIWVNFINAAGNRVAPPVAWGGTMDGYVFGGVPPVNDWTRQGGTFGAGITNRPIPSTARWAEIGIWFQYSGSGTSAVEQGAQDIRLEDITVAAAAQQAIEVISNDSILSRNEKPELVLEWTRISNEKTQLETQATAFSIGNAKTTYLNAFTALSNYLPAGWNNYATDTAINRTTFNNTFADYYAKRDALVVAIGNEAKARADAAQTTADAKLNNGADVLKGVLSVNTTYAAGLRVGTMTWGTNGVRTAGYGVAITPGGLVGFKSDGTNTFTLNAATGDAYFNGTLGANNVKAVNIEAGAITADKIQAGAITAGKIAAGAVTASSLAVAASKDNLVTDPRFKDKSWWVGNVPDTVVKAADWVGTDGSLWRDAASLYFYPTAYTIYHSKPFYTEPGATYRVEISVYLPPEFAGQFSVSCLWPASVYHGMGQPDLYNWVDPGSAVSVQHDSNSPKGFRSFSAVYTVPQHYYNTSPHFVVQSKVSAGWVEIGDIRVTRVSDSVLIKDGAVTASKISVGSLDAVSATIGTLRTATVGARTEIQSNLITVYDGNNRPRVKLGIW